MTCIMAWLQTQVKTLPPSLVCRAAAKVLRSNMQMGSVAPGSELAVAVAAPRAVPIAATPAGRRGSAMGVATGETAAKTNGALHAIWIGVVASSSSLHQGSQSPLEVAMESLEVMTQEAMACRRLTGAG